MRSARSPLLFALLAVTAAFLWLPPIDSSLWLDELDTVFTAKDGVLVAIERNLRAHPQCSTLYNAIMALVIRWFGSSEVVLRLPSLGAIVVALALLYRLGARLFDHETALFACLVFVALPDIAFAAVDARSYAFATAAAIASTYYLVQLLDLPTLTADRSAPSSIRRSGRLAVAYGLTAALAVHFHQLFGLMLVAHGLVALFLLVRGELCVPTRALTLAAACFLLAVSPVLAPFLTTLAAREQISYAPRPTLFVLLSVWSRPEIVASLVPLALFMVARGESVAFKMPRTTASTWLLLVTSAVLPPAAIFFLSELSTVSFFQPRYFLCAYPAIALLAAVAFRALEPPGLRIAAASIYAVLSVAAYSRAAHVEEDWRAMQAAIREEADETVPVLLNSHFIEAVNIEWLELPDTDDRKAFLLSPVAYYPLPGPVSLLPYRLSPDGLAYLERAIVPSLEGADRFVCVWRQRRDSWVEPWFDGRYAMAGYTARKVYTSPSLNAVIYERAPR